MEKRKLGNSGLEIAPLVFGGNVFGWTADEQTSFKLLDAFVEAGFNCIDTANSYSSWVPGNKGGESETIIGNWLKQRGGREQIIIATKVGAKLEGKGGLGKDYIRQQVEASLKRLQTDYIDLYQSHYDDPETPLEETLEAYTKLIQEGKVRAIGASNFSGERLEQALKASEQNNLARYESFQPEYNLYDREAYEKEIEPICTRYGLGVINYYALASGFLTGKYRSEADFRKSPRGGGMKNYLNERGIRILKALDEVAEQYNTTPASVSLAWLMARPSITAPIASATKLEQLEDLVKAAGLRLDQAAIKKLDEASAY
ncbi:aldo/keto reductase [Pontibacter indicus]|uniref:Predicted oxidoreductase n=1 Tax=Pontibacter indicus TaxID=1317125 RepID=A0A1R3X6L7_9BACT|nr:aldo/keto reductase [Pontibacter indicus]SIT86331.1 Predicted oxidoreductase [Pontibacter indicus]